jgi:PAS domain S-box-containing protein
MSTDVKTEQALRAENAELRARLEEAEETLRAIRGGEVDALVVGEQVYMLESADAASNRFRGEVLAQVNDAVIAVDNDNRITYVNPAAERQYRVNASEVLGRVLDDVVHYRWLHPEDEAAARRALSETGVWRGGNIHRKRDGEEIHVESTVNVLRDGGGAAVGLLGVIRDITGRRRAEEALRESEERYRTLFDTMDEAYYVIEVLLGANNRPIDYRFLETNPAFERLTGLKDVRGRTVREVVPSIEESWIKEYGEIALTGEPHRLGGRVAGLADRWYEGYAFRLGGQESRLVAVVFSDITERKHAEVALRASEAQLQTLIETAPLGIYLVDEDFRIRQINSTALPVFASMPDPIGRDFNEVIRVLWSQEYADELVKLFRHTLETGEPHVESERIEKRCDSGVTEYYEWQLNRVPLPDGRNGVVCYFRDISASVFARHTIAESEERLRLTTESVTDYAIMTTDAEGRINSWNVGAERIFGYSEEEIKGRHTEILFTPEDRGRGVPEAEMKTAREAGRALDERWHISKRGVRFYVSGVTSPLRANGVLTGYAKIARDLTERKEFEDALRRAHDELEGRVRERTLELAEANASLQAEVRERSTAEERIRSLLRQIVTVQEEERRRIARELHDTLGQQLAALRLSIDIIKSKMEGRAGVSEAAERMQSIFDRLNSDVDFLAWELRPAALDELGLDAAIQTFVRDWSEHFRIEAHYQGFGLDGPRLPPEVETNLYRILQEALQNVHKHAGAGHVSVVLERRDGLAVLVIEDDGKGYDPEAEVAGDSSKGMGVVNMRERAALVGGSLEIESASGAGATIFVHVPLGGDVEGGPDV